MTAWCSRSSVDKDKSDSEFKVTFTLHDNIDNEAPDFNDDGVPDLLSANEQLLGLPIHFKITDSDGSSVGGTLPIKVEDDKPFFGEVVGVGATMEIIGDLPEDISVTHDETKGAQSDDGADDQSFFDFVPYPPFIEINFPLIAVAADLYDQVINQAGFSLPYGDSVGALLGAAQSQVKVSFGADGATQEHLQGHRRSVGPRIRVRHGLGHRRERAAVRAVHDRPEFRQRHRAGRGQQVDGHR